MKYSRQEQILRSYVREALSEGAAATAGHVLLDLAGLVPGVGEFADATNAIWYAKEGDYLSAALSLVSLIPIAGDVIGKSGKVAVWVARLGQAGKKATDAGKYAVKAANWISKNRVIVRKVFEEAGANEKLAQYVGKMETAIDDFVGQYSGQQPETAAAGQQQSGSKEVGTTTRAGARRAERRAAAAARAAARQT